MCALCTAILKIRLHSCTLYLDHSPRSDPKTIYGVALSIKLSQASQSAKPQQSSTLCTNHQTQPSIKLFYDITAHAPTGILPGLEVSQQAQCPNRPFPAHVLEAISGDPTAHGNRNAALKYHTNIYQWKLHLTTHRPAVLITQYKTCWDV